jgi:hypothetical protein
MNTRRFLALLLVTLAAAAPLTAAEPTAIGLTAPTTLVTVPWGEGQGELRFSPESGPGEGLPTSFLMDRIGRIHILDAAAHRIVRVAGDGGAQMPPIDLLSQGLVKPNSVLLDFDLAADGSYVVLDQTAGTLLRVGPDGAALGRFGALRNGREVACARNGRLLASDPGLPAVNLFDAAGKFLGERRGSKFSVYCDAKGRVYGQQLAGPRRATLLRTVSADSSKLSLLTTVVPDQPDHELVEPRVIGVDDAGRVYLEVIEVKDGHWLYVRLLRFSAEGVPAGELRVAQCQEEFMSPPRYWRPTPDGRVLAYRTHTAVGYTLVQYRFPH